MPRASAHIKGITFAVPQRSLGSQRVGIMKLYNKKNSYFSILPQVVAEARIPLDEVPEWAATHWDRTSEESPPLKGMVHIKDQITVEELTLLYLEVGNRGVHLGILTKEEIRLLMDYFELVKLTQNLDFKIEVINEFPLGEWKVTVPSGHMIFGEDEDEFVWLKEAKLNF